MTPRQRPNQTGLQEAPELSKRERERRKPKPKAWPLPSTLAATLQHTPSLLASLRQHTAAFSLPGVRRLLLRRLIHNILRVVALVFTEALHPKYRIVLLFTLASRNTVLSDFIFLISKVRLKEDLP